MVRPWVELSLDQYEQLKKLRESTGKPISGMIREAVARFVEKKDYSLGGSLPVCQGHQEITAGQ